jgi:hypothetical protein
VIRLPPLSGRPIEVRYRAEAAGIHAGSFLPERRISFDPELRRDPRERDRIFVHELMHFAWVRLGNQRRWSYESLLAAEWRSSVYGELGWSAERLKIGLSHQDLRQRTRAWRLYTCESFCDTGAWLFAGIARHAEFTLAAPARARRRRWFVRQGLNTVLPV